MKMMFFARLCVLVLVFALTVLSTVAQTAPRSGFATSSDGARIHYLDYAPEVILPTHPEQRRPVPSTGPILLFVPGWTMPAWIWEPQLAHFRRSHHVVAMDPRSQGQSDRPRDGHFPEQRARDIRAVVEHLKLESVVLVGWSMGVQEVVAYIDQFGTEGVAGVVLVDGIAGGEFNPQLTPVLLEWVGNFQRNRAAVTDAFVRSMYTSPQEEDYLRRVIEAAMSVPTDSAVALFHGSFTTDLRPALAKIDRPALIAYTPDGPWTALYQEMGEKIPGARVEVFAGAGHALFVDHAERFNSLLEEFLRSLPARSR
jgi:non-heme chloroperoxidase